MSSDYIYYRKWNFSDIFKSYDGSKGYAILRPYPGGFNNIRMSLELAVCIAYLTNKTLVLPPKYNMYLLKDQVGMEDFFDIEDIGVKTMSLERFATVKGILPNYEDVGKISTKWNEPPERVINFAKIEPNWSFHKGRTSIPFSRVDSECIFLDGTLLGSWYQTIHSSKDEELKKLVARHVHYKAELFDLGSKAVNWLGDKNYYAVHVRRNEFQYKHLYISSEELLENLKGQIPKSARLYIATDCQDREYFKPLADYYRIFFYEDVVNGSGLQCPHYNYIPIIEQLICTRAIVFVATDYSTLSGYIYRMRGYMDDIEDKKFRINTSPYSEEEQWGFLDCRRYIGNWAREFAESWDFESKKIFVSIASYCDQQLIPTIRDLLSRAQNPSRVYIGVHIQNTPEAVEELKSCEFPNIRIIHTLPEDSMGVVWAREMIKDQLFKDEDYFLQVDSHSRFKDNWDGILIRQHLSLPPGKTLISTCPNEFRVDDTDCNYFKIATNSPLKVNGFIGAQGNTVGAINTRTLNDFELVESKWIACGFTFAPREWVKQIRVKTDIRFKGEEDYLFFSSYLNGWTVWLPSEATVWHSYQSGAEYRKHNNNPIVDLSHQRIDELLFDWPMQRERSVDDLERYIGLQFRKDRYFNKGQKYTVGIYGSHNASVAIARDDTLLEVVEVERFVSRKNAGLWFYYHLPEPLNIDTLKEIRDYLQEKYKVEKYDKVVHNSVHSDKYTIFPAVEYVWYPHHESHACGAFYQSPFDRAVILSYDGGSDEGFFNVYLGDKIEKTLNKIYRGNRDYAVPYMMPSHYIEDIRKEDLFWGNLVYAGKIMGLAGYGDPYADDALYRKFLQLYNSGDRGDTLATHKTFVEIFGDHRRHGKEAKDMAAINQRVFEELIIQEIGPILEKYPDLPLVIAGGCGLNVLANTRLKTEFGRKVFVPPNPNDAGLGVGVLARDLKPMKPFDCTYAGPPVWDRRELMSHVLWRNGHRTNVNEVVDMISQGMIFGVVRGNCEHGPRALGNRSIICSATKQNMKDILNAKVKNREYYRPFAPVVRLEDVSKFFEWEGESRWMTFSPKVRDEWKQSLPAITHIDGTARVQTVTREQNEFIYDLLTEMHRRELIPVLINTSFNVAGKPILNTYREALQVLDTTKLDAVIFEDFLINKSS